MKTRVSITACLSVSALLWNGCLDTCGDTPKQTLVSPNKRTEAKLLERNCGATAPYSTVVTLRRADSWFDRTGDMVFVAEGRLAVQLEWHDDSNLLVRCDACADTDVFQQKAEWRDVKIGYRGEPTEVDQYEP